MRTKILFFIITCCFLGSTTAQNLEKYQYVQVPVKFEFLKEENQYQLNALTAFLFKKYGFEVLYEEDIPNDIELCEVLQANVENKSAIFRSRVYVTLKDCNDKEVFTSKVGASREKDFKRSYQEALREAFTSFEGVRDNSEVLRKATSGDVVEAAQPAEVVVDPVPVSSKVQKNEVISEVVVDPVVTSEEINAAKVEFSDKPVTSRIKALEFVNANIGYTLESTPAGYDLFREGDEEKFATLIKSGGGDHYLYSSKTLSGNAFFDSSGNLVVEYLDPNSQQLISVIYMRKDQ